MYCSCFDVCLYLQYACLDTAMPRQEVYSQTLQVNKRAMELLVRQVRLRRSAEQKVALLKKELQATKGKLEMLYSSWRLPSHHSAMHVMVSISFCFVCCQRHDCHGVIV